jgi:monofunctional biosynthetic peptidoglycan transglycosylase
MKTKGLIPRLWRLIKKIFIILFIAQFVYIILLKWIDPPITLTQLGSLLTGHGLKRNYVGRKSISPEARLAVIAAEDQLFPDHNGFDFKSIEKARKHNQKTKSLHGASTISQQTAKNVFLWQGRSMFRKALEVYFTFMIEKIWGKKRILEVYLNVIEMGDGIFGIDEAAQVYFKRHADKLSWQQSAQIAACLPNPKRFKVKPLSNFVASRSGWITNQMNHLHGDPDIRKIIYNQNTKK